MKAAILVECDPGTTLGGSCFRDVHNMATNLISRCHFMPNDIYVLTTAHPSKRIEGVNYHTSAEVFNILQCVRSTTTGTALVLVSGHGFSVGDQNGDEQDGCDELINVGGRQIRDDELYEALKGFPCKLVLLSDTCHSGTMFDLPYKQQGSQWIRASNRQEDFPQQAISISACSDQQLSMCDIGDVAGFGGSLTTSLLEPGVLETLVNEFNGVRAHDMIQSRVQLLGQTSCLTFGRPQ